MRHSILSPKVSVSGGAYVEGSVLLDGVQIGAGAVVRKAILDKDVVVPPGANIGVDLELDRQRYHVTPSGVVVLGKATVATL